MEVYSKGKFQTVKLSLKPKPGCHIGLVSGFLCWMLKFLFFFSLLMFIPQSGWAQTRFAVVDYAGLTDSLNIRWRVQPMLDSVRSHHIAKGKQMVERFLRQVTRDQKLATGGGCISREQYDRMVQKLEKMQQEIVACEERIFNTAIPALDFAP